MEVQRSFLLARKDFFADFSNSLELYISSFFTELGPNLELKYTRSKGPSGSTYRKITLDKSLAFVQKVSQKISKEEWLKHKQHKIGASIKKRRLCFKINSLPAFLDSYEAGFDLLKIYFDTLEQSLAFDASRFGASLDISSDIRYKSPALALFKGLIKQAELLPKLRLALVKLKKSIAQDTATASLLHKKVVQKPSRKSRLHALRIFYLLQLDAKLYDAGTLSSLSKDFSIFLSQGKSEDLITNLYAVLGENAFYKA